MSYFAATAVRDKTGWSATELSLADAADLEDVTDRMRDVEPAADLALLFVESDDAYLAILRLDHGEDLRVFASDVAFAEDSRLGALLLSDLGEPLAEIAAAEVAAVDEVSPAEDEAGEDESDVAGSAAGLGGAEPAGDLDLLTDLGVDRARLMQLCTQEGMLPSDITAEVTQAIGCGDEVEELREA